MTGQEMLDALQDSSGGIRVVSQSGKLYDVERDVVTSNADEVDPYIYGWPVKPHPRAPKVPRWFYARNVQLAEPDDQVNI